jgi:amino-acid N-acetyltransferase
MGIIDGVDLQLTGVVRKVDTDACASCWPTAAWCCFRRSASRHRRAFNLTMEDVACSVATALKADKRLLTETAGINGPDGALLSEISMETPRACSARPVSGGAAFNLRTRSAPAAAESPARTSCHLRRMAASWWSFSPRRRRHDGGAGKPREDARRHRGDVGGIIKLIEPLEADGTLVKRPRELIEREIDRFIVSEHDGFIFGCAALYPFPKERTGELACLTVHPQYQGYGDGERLMKRIEARAKAAGIDRLFVLTTRTAHFFIKRGFQPATVDDLPPGRQNMYNWQRRSQVLIKTL